MLKLVTEQEMINLNEEEKLASVTLSLIDNLLICCEDLKKDNRRYGYYKIHKNFKSVYLKEKTVCIKNEKLKTLLMIAFKKYNTLTIENISSWIDFYFNTDLDTFNLMVVRLIMEITEINDALYDIVRSECRKNRVKAI